MGSALMDTSSELIHSLLPVLMTSVLKASLVTVGIVEGVAEGAAAATKVVSGAWSDYLGRRKPLLLLGYGLAALTKPIFPLADAIGWVFAARVLDRVGKGIRGSPRDALVADLTPSELRGAAYGLRQALDSIGAVCGPLLAVGLMLWWGNVQLVMWAAVAPAVATVLLLFFFVREPERIPAKGEETPRLTWEDAGRLPWEYWIVVWLGAVFTLARFSEAFLVLRAQDVGLSAAYIPLVMVSMNVAYAACAYPAGAAADSLSPRTLLLAGLALLIAADAALAVAAAPWVAFAGAGLWGLHMAFTQGLFAKLVADAAPEALRGTAFGLFHLISGAALVAASTAAGVLWSSFGPASTFLAGAGFAALAAAGVLLLPEPVGAKSARPASPPTSD
jgi:MFS family permease